jgi:hypothetical protein
VETLISKDGNESSEVYPLESTLMTLLIENGRIMHDSSSQTTPLQDPSPEYPEIENFY